MSDRLLRAFIEAQGYKVEEALSDCMPFEADGDLDGAHFKRDYKITKDEGGELFLGSWMGVDIFVRTEQKEEVMQLMAHLKEAKNENI